MGSHRGIRTPTPMPFRHRSHSSSAPHSPRSASRVCCWAPSSRIGECRAACCRCRWSAPVRISRRKQHKIAQSTRAPTTSATKNPAGGPSLPLSADGPALLTALPAASGLSLLPPSPPKRSLGREEETIRARCASGCRPRPSDFSSRAGDPAHTRGTSATRLRASPSSGPARRPGVPPILENCSTAHHATYIAHHAPIEPSRPPADRPLTAYLRSF